MSDPRVLITGVGVVTAFGAGLARHAGALFGDATAIGPLTLVDLPGARVATAAQVPADAIGPGPAHASRADRLALTAAREATVGLTPDELASCALFVGGTTAGMFEAESILAALTADPSLQGFEAGPIPGHVLTSPADVIVAALGPFASSHTVCSACAGGALAIALALAAIRSGRAPRALAGGVDAMSRMSLAGFASLLALDLGPCRPFDAARGGLTLGEGSSFVLLEREGVAGARGARAKAELAGAAIGAEAHHTTQPAPDGRIAAATMSRAVERAGLRAADVGYVNAHGTATPANDPMEAAAIARVFGRVAVSSSKGHLGHTLAAAGAIEAVITACALETGRLPPTVGLREVDPACAAVDHVTMSRPAAIGAAVSNAFGFGGNDVVLALRSLASPPPIARAALRPDDLVVTATATVGPLGAGAGAQTHIADARPRVDARRYLEAGDVADVPFDLASLDLDPAKVRRFDRASRLAAWVAAEVMRGGPGADATGVVVGSAFGSVEATGRLLRELFEKGPRFVSPAVFPTVLPSALAAHASIHLGLHGPAFSCADLGVSAESALALGALVLDDGQADAMIVAAVEEHGRVASRVSSPRVSRLAGEERGEGASALLLERRAAAELRGAEPLAVLADRWSFRGGRPDVGPPTSPRARVIAARSGLGAPAGWSAAEPLRRAGNHECIGGVALAAAVTSIAAGECDEILVLGEAPDRGHVFRFVAPARRG